MKQSLKSFGLILGACALISLVLVVFNGRSVASFVELGSYAGAGIMLFGISRFNNSRDEVTQHLHMQQRMENLHAELAGREQPHQEKDMIQMSLSSGPLVFGGMAWVALLQGARYAFGL